MHVDHQPPDLSHRSLIPIPKSCRLHTRANRPSSSELGELGESCCPPPRDLAAQAWPAKSRHPGQDNSRDSPNSPTAATCHSIAFWR